MSHASTDGIVHSFAHRSQRGWEWPQWNLPAIVSFHVRSPIYDGWSFIFLCVVADPFQIAMVAFDSHSAEFDLDKGINFAAITCNAAVSCVGFNVRGLHSPQLLVHKSGLLLAG